MTKNAFGPSDVANATASPEGAARRGDPSRRTERTSPALEAVGLSKRFRLGGETIHALREVSLAVEPGQFLSVMGPSGSGKSTLLHLLGLLDTPDAGEVRLEGEAVGALDDDRLTMLRRTKLGFVFQSFELIPNLSARENILLPAEISGRGREADGRLLELSEQLGIRDRLEHRPKQLSGGQRQRVALARALINDPVVVLADEPTGNLDSQTGSEVLELLGRGVATYGWTVVMVTHDPRAALYADRIVFLKDGRLSGESSTKATDIRAMIEAFVGV